MREATATDGERLHVLLTQVGLSAHDVLAPGTRYWIAQMHNGEIIGEIGMEQGDGAVLL